MWGGMRPTGVGMRIEGVNLGAGALRNIENKGKTNSFVLKFAQLSHI